MLKAIRADAVKFQLYSHKELYGFDQQDSPWTLPKEWIPELANKAKSLDIEFMCSAFSPEGMELIDPFVARHKIASAELTHVRMLQTAKKLEKPVILSTGAHNEADIQMALTMLYPVPVTLLHCVAAYPTVDANLPRIEALKAKFPQCDIGFSDHTTDFSTIPVLAYKAYGITVLEKHFKLRDMKTPDNGHSLNPDQFKDMVSYIKGDRSPNITLSKEEKDMVLRHSRRLVAIKPIRPGDALKEGVNYGMYRAKTDQVSALPCWSANQIEGLISKCAFNIGDGISPDVLQ